MAAFLTKWASAEPAKPTTPRSDLHGGAREGALDARMALGQAEPTIPPESLHKTIMKSRLDRVEHADGVPWAEWKAAELNRLFQETGATRQVGQIIARTVEHGERSLDRKL